MGQLVVRNIEDAVKARLQRRARRRGHSMEEEVREILRNVVNEDEVASDARGLGTEISNLFSRVGLESPIAELRGQKIKPASFEP